MRRTSPVMLAHGLVTIKDGDADLTGKHSVIDEANGPKAYGQAQVAGFKRIQNGAQRDGNTQCTHHGASGMFAFLQPSVCPPSQAFRYNCAAAC